MLTAMKSKKIQGFTFIELMIALVVNTIILASLLGVLASNLNRYNQNIAEDTLNQQLQSAMNFMANDIRRAGYWSNAMNDISTSANNNPFQATATDVSVTGSCILFTYDHASTGTLPAIAAGSDDDRYGFLLSNNVILTRPPGATYSCTPAAGNWENVTNSKVVKITALTFTLTTTTVPAGSPVPYMALRGVTITITGQLVTNAAVTKTITQHVRIRNDKYVP
jgi:prepilin peptidase dependent protein B